MGTVSAVSCEECHVGQGVGCHVGHGVGCRARDMGLDAMWDMGWDAMWDMGWDVMLDAMGCMLDEDVDYLKMLIFSYNMHWQLIGLIKL